jgi:hypothetical protein
MMERPHRRASVWFSNRTFLQRKGVARMRDLQGVGPYKDVVEAPSAEDPQYTVKLGIRQDTFQQYARHLLFTAVAQYYGIVQDGLHSARHCFRGLKRPLMLGEDIHADEGVLVYTWRSLDDYEWAGTPQYGRPQPMRPTPVGIVFAVLAREQTMDECGVVGTVEHWNWVREDPNLPHAPIDWQERYGSKLWSR